MKSHIAFFLEFVAIVPFHGIQASIPKLPVAFWPFDDANLGNDVSGNGHHGVLYNISLAPGPYGDDRALGFSAADGSYIMIPNNGGLDVRNRFTLVFLMFPESNALQTLFEYRVIHRYGLHVMQHPTGTSFWTNVVENPSLREHPIELKNAFTLNTWHKAFVRYDYDSGNLDIGVSTLARPLTVGNTANIGSISASTSGTLDLGRRMIYPNRYQGRLACVQLFGTPLSLREVEDALARCKPEYKQDRMLHKWPTTSLIPSPAVVHHVASLIHCSAKCLRATCRNLAYRRENGTCLLGHGFGLKEVEDSGFVVFGDVP
ncbi:uncharacterized protein LOC106155885 [Lingula anatina]|uniref:Uncharacterized protein LOC106155885 n=1 Tax=Lingula anatina TaxID=7574 RepID=A0A1S3HJR5_LINAN|nr:uncharacterized protein LOC106155885 [Lingula anatina]|eukprot:XP_013386365.1 uncharacterized protein LOC106155885 [Lingula anatina]